MTLDGKVATRTGDSKWISGEDSRRVAHRWRAECDAVAVRHRHRAGRRPAADRPHRGRPPPAAPRRVRLRGAPAPGLRSSCAAPHELPLTVVVSRAAPRTATDALEAAGAEVVVAAGENEPARVRTRAAPAGRAAGISSILLEGGPHLAGAFLDAGEVDEMRLFVAPVVLGGCAGRDPLEGEGVERDRRGHRARSRSSARGWPTTS